MSDETYDYHAYILPTSKIGRDTARHVTVTRLIGHHLSENLNSEPFQFPFFLTNKEETHEG
jgi:hypothetical protein